MIHVVLDKLMLYAYGKNGRDQYTSVARLRVVYLHRKDPKARPYPSSHLSHVYYRVYQ